MKKYILLASVVLMSLQVFAQRYSNMGRKFWSYTVMANVINYVGELDPNPNPISPALRYTKPSIGFMASKRLDPRTTFRTSFSWGRIKGDDYVSAGTDDHDIFRKVRNQNFRNDIYELKIDFVWDLYKNLRDFRKRQDFNPYGFFGIGAFYHNPKTNFQGRWVSLKGAQTEGVDYSRLQMCIPFGLGLKYKLSKQLDLAFEIGWRFTTTDYLDDVSSNYLDPKSFKNPQDAKLADRSWETRAISATLDKGNGHNLISSELSDGSTYTHHASHGVQGYQRGDKNKDWYIITGLHLTYIIAPRVVCPKFRH